MMNPRTIRRIGKNGIPEEVPILEIIQAGKERSDGHFTLMHFTTNYRAAFYTPSCREDIDRMSCGRTEREAIEEAFKIVTRAEQIMVPLEEVIGYSEKIAQENELYEKAPLV